ncbi:MULTISPECIES: efflux RND transporter periplasmic adaptor subunit [Xanthomonas]|uniref:Uncharacterized protein n=1 Tax=Xanthomonas phaseoli pv. dieffenbachiae TaxID=92828 RepID=A0A1V9HDE0_9XANT|nr:efflux RND transporter periplasmic adaptor subunit [Xanthomonas phaseoli]MBO9770019.1 efflux RND transporter periplasmic adaptor subunit [Xanthomonas phaseoli pv. dieffenbachiae]MBO9778177.1 efflux RND transporter periplasmic adaptor subunit [Xanthomonas phaseoli pv. dieffenbachiae]MBO9782089.1 efflux RND transporter periplasmic adaptor subunit [Xanthomonas phaseoli pv. dieffenbachiae]MBO9790316.1 efflux RND transporter periplasmic adaptor subunit [Xanthomonas phaseoli pv. dieffenbachiae]MB
MTTHRTTIATTLIVLAVTTLLTACGGKPPEVGAEGAAAPQTEAAQKDGEGHEEVSEATTIPRDEADSNGVKVVTVGAGTIAVELEVQGQIAAIDGSNARVTARYPGRIRSLRANVGDRVRADQGLASIESNLSLSTYSVSTPISGVVLSRQAQVGGGAAEGQMLFEVVDLSKVWVDLSVFGAQMASVQPGAEVVVTRLYDSFSATTRIDNVLPGASAASQSAIARATLNNQDGQWRPGVAVTATVAISRRDVALVVPRSALQRMDGKDAVFVRNGETYTAHPVKLGQSDTQRVEILEGLKPGDEVVAEQSYLIKADIEKSGAAHED